MSLDQAWYALQSADSRRTANYLREANYAAYVPCERFKRVICRIKRDVHRPLFQGYVFVRCSRDALSIVRTIGISHGYAMKTLSDGVKVPAEIPESFVVEMLVSEMFGEFDRTREPAAYEPAKGDRVKITAGMWQERIGRILWVSAKGVKVDLDIGGSVKVPPGHLVAQA